VSSLPSILRQLISVHRRRARVRWTRATACGRRPTRGSRRPAVCRRAAATASQAAGASAGNHASTPLRRRCSSSSSWRSSSWPSRYIVRESVVIPAWARSAAARFAPALASLACKRPSIRTMTTICCKLPLDRLHGHVLLQSACLCACSVRAFAKQNRLSTHSWVASRTSSHWRHRQRRPRRRCSSSSSSTASRCR